MSAECSLYAIVISMLRDWLKNILLVFQPIRSKIKTNCTLYTLFFLRFEQVTVLFALVVIGQSAIIILYWFLQQSS